MNADAESFRNEIKAILDSKTKPKKSLGQLEDWAIKFAPTSDRIG
jgi:hypothetical protein